VGVIFNQWGVKPSLPRCSSPTNRTLHVLRKDADWVKKCMEYEVKGSRPRGRPKRTWREVVQKDCQTRKLNREDVVDRSRWKKLIKLG